MFSQIENSVDGKPDDLSVIHTEKYIYFIDRKNNILKRLDQHSMVMIDLNPILSKFKGSVNYRLALDCVNQHVYIVLTDKSKSGMPKTLFSVFTVTDLERTMEINNILPGFEIDLKNQTEEMKEINILSGLLNVYFTLKDNKGYQKVIFDPKKPESVSTFNVEFEAAVSNTL